MNKAAYTGANFPLQTTSILRVPRMTSRDFERYTDFTQDQNIGQQMEFQGRNDMK